MNLNHKEIWNKCLHDIRKNVNERNFNTWFKPIKPVKLENKTLTLRVPNKFFYSWLEEHYIDLLGKVLYKHIGKDARLQYQILVQDHKDIRGNYKKLVEKKFGEKSKQIFSSDFNMKLNPAYTFDNFIIAPCNHLAANAGKAISDAPGKTAFNPLIIYGGVGLGKTHLINAIGNLVKRQNPDANIIYTNTERFTSQIIRALREDYIYEFLNSFELVDLFIIDDIQFLEGRVKTQEIFFNIFNFLHQSDKQLIITADKPPKDLKGIEERLISRFKWGLITELKPPCFDTKIKILEAKAKANNLILPEEVINYLGYNVSGSIRDLEGVLVSFSANLVLSKRKPDIQLAGEVVQNFTQHTSTEINIENIQQLVAEYFHLDVNTMLGKSRKRNIVIARQLGMYFAKQMTDLSLKDIGRHFGNREHTTVLHALKTVNDLAETDPAFATMLSGLQHKLENSLVNVK